ncbi:MAG: YHS domain-containing (seleno)protein [Planctomycetota bacterium]
MRVAMIVGALAVAVVGFTFARSGNAQAGVATLDESGKKHLVAVDDQGRAVAGYDTVAYFTEGEPTPGSEEHTITWRGATWQFASAENKAAFAKDPERYAPQYGGYCAWGVAAKNDLFPVDPEAWRVEDDKLYLNYNRDVQKTWLEDVPGFIESGDANWPALEESKAK